MGKAPIFQVLRGGLIVWALLCSENAFAFDFSGAWATEPDLCNRVFAKKGAAAGFAEMSDLYGSGFIVNGNSITGRAVKCTIKSRQRDGDATVLSASCATSVMKSEFKFRYKVIDDNTIAREFPEIKDMALKYSRCPI